MNRTTFRGLLAGLAVCGALGITARAIVADDSHRVPAGPRQALEEALKAPTGKQADPSRYRTDNRGGIFMTDATRAIEVARANAARTRTREAADIKDFRIYGALGKTANRAQGALYTMTASGMDKRTDSFRSVDGGAFYDGNTYNVISEMAPGLNVWDLYCYDTDWWYSTSRIGANANVTASDMAYDPTSGLVYGCFSNGQYNPKWEFATVDYSSFNQSTIGRTRKTICSIDRWDGVAVNAEGDLYVIDKDGVLQTIDKTTGRPHTIGSTGLTPYYQGSATFDNDGRLFYSYGPETGAGALYEINTETAEPTLLIEYPEGVQIVGLFAKLEAIIPGAPARPTEMKADFPDNSMSGTVSFKLPETLNDGTPGEGTVNWTFKVNNYENQSGTAAYGETVTVDYSSWGGGNTTFSASCSNEAGSGPSAELTVYIGAEPLNSPANITTRRIGEQVTIEWDPVTATTFGTPVDADAVQYAVTDMYGNLVAEDIAEPKLTFDVEIPSTPSLMQYMVTAYIRGVTQSWGVYAPPVLLGSYNVPWTASITREEDLYQFQVIDVNKDGYTWGIYQQNILICWADNSNHPDDWIFTPGLRLEKGKLYTFKADFRCYNNTTRTDWYEVMVGTEAQPESMTLTLQEPKPATKEFVTEEYEFVPQEDGVYYFGVHSCAPNPVSGFYMRNISVSGPASAITPEAPEMTVMTDLDGTTSADITVVAPSTNRAGEPLTSLSTLSLYRDNVLISTQSSVKPGQKYSFNDAPDEAGVHEYKAVATGPTGTGKPSVKNVYIGVNLAATPTGAVATETSDGTVTVTWNPVTTDQDGNFIRPEFVTYYLLELDGENQIAIAEDLTDTSYTFEAVKDGEPQQFKQYGVAAKTTAGYSKGVLTQQIPVGKPLTLPYAESFANGSASTPFAVRALVPAYAGSWFVASDESFTDLNCSDGDNGFAYYYGKYIDCPSLLYTGKISLTGADHPVLSFNLIDLYFDLKDKEDYRNTTELAVMIDLLDGEGFRTIWESSIADACDVEGWTRMLVDLNEYKGKTVMIGFKGTTKRWVYINIDAIRIGDVSEQDLAIKYIDAPKFTTPDSPFKVTARIENVGSKTAESALAQLYLNGELADTQEIPELTTGKKADVVFEQTLSHYNENANDYRVEIVWPGDQDADNNVSETAHVTISRTELPGVTDLSAQIHEDQLGVDLSWEAPVVAEGAMPPYTETFEEAGSWSNEVEGWIFVDADHGGAGGMNTGLIMPGVPNGSEQSWFVIDQRLSWLDSNRESSMNFAAYDGNKYIAAIYSMDFSTGPYPVTSVPNDDWAISPELSGKAQTVKFMARSYSPYFLENFEVLYSETGTDIDDFYTLQEVSDVPADEWTEYEFNLPEGAKYFAIRYTADYKYMLFVDNVTYTPFNPSPLAHLGYDLYRNGEKVNSEPLTECEYSERYDKETLLKKPVYDYAVCAVYNHGISSPSRIQLKFEVNGIDAVENHVAVYGGRGHIFVIGAEGMPVSVATAGGLNIWSGVPEGNSDFAVTPGIYVVRAGSRTFKIHVK